MTFSRGLLRDCTTGCGTDGSICGTNADPGMLYSVPCLQPRKSVPDPGLDDWIGQYQDADADV